MYQKGLLFCWSNPTHLMLSFFFIFLLNFLYLSVPIPLEFIVLNSDDTYNFEVINFISNNCLNKTHHVENYFLHLFT